MTGDPRLGSVLAYRPGLELGWTLFGQAGDFGSMTLLGGYGLSVADYEHHGGVLVWAHIGWLGLEASH